MQKTVIASGPTVATVRTRSAICLEFEMLIAYDPRGSPGRVLTRDGGAERAFATLVRYRNGAQAEFVRRLKALNAQAPAAKADPAGAPRSKMLGRRPRGGGLR